MYKLTEKGVREKDLLEDYLLEHPDYISDIAKMRLRILWFIEEKEDLPGRGDLSDRHWNARIMASDMHRAGYIDLVL